jgi:hypothetical protein
MQQRCRRVVAAALGVALSVLLVLLGACAPKRPVLYPNRTLQQVGEVQAGQDVAACLEQAAADGHQAHPVARSLGHAGIAAAVGAAGAAAWGAVRGGNVGSWAGAGAAGGAGGGFVRGLLGWREPDPIQARYVSVCLGDQGYRVIGWK